MIHDRPRPTMAHAGDLVYHCGPYKRSLYTKYTDAPKTKVTGVVTDTRKVEGSHLKEYARPWEAEVLCTDGRLRWYSMDELEIVERGGYTLLFDV